VIHEWGPATGRPLLFWPGLNPWGTMQLVEVGPLLAARDVHVLSIEPPGVGATAPLDDPDAYLPTRLAQRVIDIADERGLDRFTYMGHSWGATIGVHLAAGHADRLEGLVLCDGGYDDVPVEHSREELVRLYEADQQQFAFDSWDDWFAWARERVRDWRPSLEPRYGEAGMTERDGQIVPRASARAAAWAWYGVSVEPPSSAHPKIRVPVLLLLASDADAAAFLARVPDVTVHRLDSGHDVPEDAPEETARLVVDWLDTLSH
jgi:pimeloyl-ACP methyl ester carboxylesterase